MPFGHSGKILHVDLSKLEWQVEEPGEKWYRTYMGGSAFASYYLLKLLKPGVDPLSPENVLIFACSVVTGVPISGWDPRGRPTFGKLVELNLEWLQSEMP
ncbi:MAG: hypothetical protein NTW71_08260 [Deltaproteobacteria bacterium]|nr:hypothetical protein [Deltaproteobacteria bacterium]